MEMTGAEAILASLKEEQVPVVFGYPGGAVLACMMPFTAPGSPISSLAMNRGRGPCSGRVCPGYGKSGGLHRYQRSRGLQYGHRDRYR